MRRLEMREVERPWRRETATSRKAGEAAHPIRAQHNWEKRFYDFNVWTEHKRIEKLRDMRRNPVKRGLVVSPELWRWSSFRAYFLSEAGAVRVNEWDVLRMKVRPPAAECGA